MFGRIRRNFLLVSLFSVFVVLFVLLGSINISNYFNMASGCDEVVGMILDNDGTFPDGKRHDPDSRPELPFQTRYFDVTFTPEGAVYKVALEHIAITQETAVQISLEVYGNGYERGFVENYRYGHKTLDDGNELYVFMDSFEALDDFYVFMRYSILFGSIGFALVAILLFFLSGRVLSPVKESFEKQKRFITDAGHELKTPLSIISADTEIIEMQSGSTEWTSSIKEQAARLANMTEKLVLMAKMDEGKPLVMSSVDISASLEEATKAFAPLAETKKMEIDYQGKPGLNISANPDSLEQIWGLLLDNAIKYSDGKTIKVRLFEEGKFVKAEFSNHCSDISEESLQHVFERFYRNDASRNSSTGGHGIGLSLAEAIMNAHKGKIKASYDEGMVTFSLSFPK